MPWLHVWSKEGMAPGDPSGQTALMWMHSADVYLKLALFLSSLKFRCRAGVCDFKNHHLLVS